MVIHSEWSLGNFDDGVVNQGRMRVFSNHPRADNKQKKIISDGLKRAYKEGRRK